MGRDTLRLDILMDYSAQTRDLGAAGIFGSAATRWTSLASESVPIETWQLNRAILAALHYAKILTFVPEEAKAALFDRIDEAVKNSFLSEENHPLEFAPWNVPLFDPLYSPHQKSVPVWPWLIVAPEVIETLRPRAAVGNPKIYSSTLKVSKRASAPAGFWIYLDMPMGNELVLPAASVLIVLSTLSKELEGNFQKLLDLLIWHVNRFYGSPSAVTLGSEARAVAGAMSKIQAEMGAVPSNP